MSNKFYILAMFFSAVILGPALSIAACDDTQNYTVVYINGMLTGVDSARFAQRALENEFMSYSKYADHTVFRLGENPTRGLSADSFKAAFQASYDEGEAHSLDLDATNILRALHGNLTTQKILLVGHSQGTFYTNELYTYLIAHGVAKESIAVYNIGTPASYVAGGGRYLTNTTDNVINTVRTATWLGRGHAPLPGNVHIPFEDEQTDNDWRGHSIVGVYLKGEGERIVKDMDTLLARLKVSDVSQDTCFTKPSLLNSPQAAGEAMAILLTPAGTGTVVDTFVTTQVSMVRATWHVAKAVSDTLTHATAVMVGEATKLIQATTHFMAGTSDLPQDTVTTMREVLVTASTLQEVSTTAQASEAVAPPATHARDTDTELASTYSDADIERLAAMVVALEKLLLLLQQQRALGACDTSLFKVSNCINPFDPGGFGYGAGGSGGDVFWSNSNCPPGVLGCGISFN